MKRLFLSIIRQYLFWMVFFFILRAIFLVYHIKLVANDGAGFAESMLSFWYALKLDTATTGYILVLPALIIFIQGLFSTNWLDMVNKVYTFIIILCWAVITAVELGSFSEWKYKLNTGAFMHLNNTREGIESLSIFQVTGLLIFLIIVTGGSFLLYGKVFYHKITEKVKPVFRPFIYLVVSMPALFIMLRGGFNDIAISESSAFYSHHNVLNWVAVNSGYHLAVNAMETSRYKKSNNYQFYDLDEARKTVDNIYKVEKDSTVSILKSNRPNIVILIMESWSADLIESLGGNPGITPEFARLEKDGLLFTHFYASGNRSHEGIASIIGGCPALPYTTFTANPIKFPQLPSMVSELDSAGYQSSFFYGGQLNYGNLRAYLLSCNIQNIIEGTDISDLDGTVPRGRLGVHDEYMLRKQIEFLKAVKEPFISMLFSISTHSPYDFPMKPVIDWAGDLNPYINSAYYADKCLGEYFEMARKQPWYNNTVFIITADHSHDTYKHWRGESFEFHHIPLLIYGEMLNEEYRGVKIGRIADNSSLPKTILKQMDLPVGSFKWGSDLFNPYSPEFAYVVLNDGFMWKTPKGEVVYSMMWSHYYSKKFPEGTSSKEIESFIRNGKSYVQVLFQEFLDL